MTQSIRIAIGQLNPALGDLPHNCGKAVAALEESAARGADLLVLPEMFLSGYPLQDLATNPGFVGDCMAAVRRLAKEAARCDMALAVGGPLGADDGVYNVLHVIAGGEVRAVVRKHHLPGTGVFDEPRVFVAGGSPGPVAIGGVRIGFSICEDAWKPDVAETLAESGAELLVVANGSPYERDKHEERIQVMLARVVETGLPIVYANLVGGQDDLVYDGGSFVLNPGGDLAVQAPFFEEAILHTEWQRESAEQPGWHCRRGERVVVGERAALDYRCIVSGLRDFARKNGFTETVLGLSGGIDSALVAAIAADALGPERVRAVLLPSRFTSEESTRCATAVASWIGCTLDTVSIECCIAAVEETLADAYRETPGGTTGENLQARFRGLLLMAVANAGGELLLATGNKSEIAVGYATLYGDMCGGYACLKDLYKTRVYELARWRNRNHADWMLGPEGRVIPEEVLTREPTAELRPDQRDRDSLPDYAELDSILELLIEGDRSPADAVATGHDPATVDRVAALLRGSEFKRYQSAPGPKLTRRAFWLERRYPITNRYDPAAVAAHLKEDPDDDRA